MLRVALSLIAVATLGFSLSYLGPRRTGTIDARPKTVSPSEALAATPASSTESADNSTEVLMHNVVLNAGPTLKLYVRWLRGWMRPTRSGVTPSFDDPKSFALDISTGVVKVNLSDVAATLNSGMLQGSPLRKVSLAASGKQLKVNGTVHKILPLPFEMVGDLAASPDGRIVMHVANLRVLKIPLK